MPGTRPPAVAGSFYPAGATRLAAEVDRLLGPVRRVDPPRALVVPHAGYACSGPVAAAAYRTLGRPAGIRSVVVLGPAHYADPDRIAFPGADCWATPLGEVRVDHALGDRLAHAGLAHADDSPHQREHAIEVQLPFLQRLLPDGWSFLPLAVPAVPAGVVADCLDLLASDDVLAVCSTDLSHYFDDPSAQRLDRRTAAAVVGRDAAGVGSIQACGVHPLRGVLLWARRHDLRIELLDLSTSARTCSGPDRVVGYGAFAVGRPRASAAARSGGGTGR